MTSSSARRSKAPADGRLRVARSRGHNALAWTAELAALLGEVPDRAVAERAGVSPGAVVEERHRRGVAPFLVKRARVEWTQEMIAVLGTDSDGNVAASLGVPRSSVRRKRNRLGIPPYYPPPDVGIEARSWSPRELALLGRMPDSAVAEEVGLSTSTVNWKRRRLGIPAFQPAVPPVEWTEEKVTLLGEGADTEVAERLGISAGTVKRHRRRRGIAASAERRPVEVTDELVELLRLPSVEERRRTGLKFDTIASLRRRLGRSTQAVRHKRWQLDVPAFHPVRQRRWRQEEIALLGNTTDADVGRRLGRSSASVESRRRALGIPLFPGRTGRPWRPEELALVGTASDEEIAERLGRPLGSVRRKRQSLGLPAAVRGRRGG